MAGSSQHPQNVVSEDNYNLKLSMTKNKVFCKLRENIWTSLYEFQQKSILDLIRGLSDEQYKAVMINGFDTSRPSQVQKFIVKSISKKGSKSAAKGGEGGVDQGGKLVSCPPRSVGQSAWKVSPVLRISMFSETWKLHIAHISLFLYFCSLP